MNALRNVRVLVSAVLVAVLALGLSIATAEAGGHKKHKNHKHWHKAHFHKAHHTHKLHKYYPAHYKHALHYPTAHPPFAQYGMHTYYYPVTLYDCHGHPYVEWKTGYRTLPHRFHP